jgi:release factor glutamine methyltransferase
MAFNLQTIKDIRKYIAGELKDIYPETEIRSLSEMIILYALDINKISLFSDLKRPVSPPESESIKQLCNELKKGKPIQYVTGETLFYNCTLKVNPDVLIPRPETEELVDLIVRENRGFTGEITDIGTGSGCIAIALAVNLPCSSVTATDISAGALLTAEENARLNNAAINFVRADIFGADKSEIGKPDIIVSNPPYIRESEKLLMHRNVLDFEPHEALFVPDDDPLVYYRAILNAAKIMLKPGSKIYFEINEAMGINLCRLMESYNYTGIQLIKDINGKDRIIKGVKNG